MKDQYREKAKDLLKAIELILAMDCPPKITCEDVAYEILRTVAQEEYRRGVEDAVKIVMSYLEYHRKGPDECCTKAQFLTAQHILNDLKALGGPGGE